MTKWIFLVACAASTSNAVRDLLLQDPWHVRLGPFETFAAVIFLGFFINACIREVIIKKVPTPVRRDDTSTSSEATASSS